ncbi:MAG: lysylphosphatidylglycerol synthase transmembrane domain-containing protein [Janthinobacterium lividum]
MDRRKAVLWAGTALLLGLVAWKLHTSHFDWGAFWQACRRVDARLLVLATLILYLNFPCRAARWAVLLKPSFPAGGQPAWWRLTGSQFIGFAGLAALGRIGELIRPYLVSRRTGLTFSSQIAVVAVERIFDLGAFGILFAGNLLLSSQLNNLPYHNRYHLFGYAIAAAIAVLSLFVAFTLYAGEAVARLLGGIAGKVSRSAGIAVAARVLEFRQGLNTIGSFSDFLLASFYSLLTWLSIAVSYVVVLRAFPAPLHSMTISHVVLLMGFSVVGSVVQLPGIGGGAQLLTITALTVLFGIPRELASSAGLILWVVSSMSVILPGVIFARVEQVSLRSVAQQSGQAKELHEPHPVH